MNGRRIRFNPWLGCQKVHAGCTNCYAEDMMDRRYGKAKWGPNGTRVLTSEANWKKPLKWNRDAAKDRSERSEYYAEIDLAAPPVYVKPRVFCGSLCDWAEEWNGPMLNARGCELVACESCGYVGPDGLRCSSCGKQTTSHAATMDDVRFRLLDLAASCENLNWLFLTKRPERVPDILIDWQVRTKLALPERIGEFGVVEIPSNWWFGCSVSDQETADAAIPRLLDVRCVAPQSKLFVSYEPALGPVYWWQWLPSIEWIICGGESGAKARPCNVEWIRSTADQCRAAEVACFVKQDSGPRPGMQGRIPDEVWSVKEVPR